jgi:3-hydroxybutyryl-CoA dehydrogenase
MGPLAIVDMIGMRTQHALFDHWGKSRNDHQMVKNAEYLKRNFLDRELYGLENGEGFYTYPDPSFNNPGFIAVPELTDVPDIVKRAVL